MSAARTILTVAAALVVVPLAMRSRESAPAAAAITSAIVQFEEGQASPADIRAFLEAVRGSNAIQCEIVLQSFNSWSSNHAPDRDSLAWRVTRVTHRRIRSPELVPDLVTAMKSGDACAARVAARMLGRSELQPARRELLSALGDSDAQVRQLAAIGLGFSNDSTTSRQLVGALADRDARVRAAAAWALGAVHEQ
jgi:HEAT repeat protein